MASCHRAGCRSVRQSVALSVGTASRRRPAERSPRRSCPTAFRCRTVRQTDKRGDDVPAADPAHRGKGGARRAARRSLRCRARSTSELVIAGRGPLEDEMRQAAADDPRIRFVGYVTGEAKQALLEQARLSAGPVALVRECAGCDHRGRRAWRRGHRKPDRRPARVRSRGPHRPAVRAGRRGRTCRDHAGIAGWHTDVG